MKGLLEPWVERMKSVLGKIPYRQLSGEDAARLHALGYL
jgi:hypothetical protein